MPSPLLVSPEQIMQEKDELARRGIELGREVLAVEYADGVAFIAENASSTLNKVSEVYDRIAFAGVGSFQEYDPLRMVGIEHSEVKGYTYSREDVTARWLANLYSQYVGNVWRQFDAKPLEIELLVAEVGEPGISPTRLYRISYDGRLSEDKNVSVIGGKAEALRSWLLERFAEGLALDAAVRLALDALRTVREGDETDQDEAEGAREEISSERLEVAVLDRHRGRRKFRRLASEEIADLIGDVAS
ncbi:proteasome subunit alpha [Candidatus Poribacteria bacterium]|nr:proteasome subunit alpha [Candidatus Poribacteria bacterium]